MVYGINYLLGNTWQSVGFLVQVSHYGCFIFIFLLIKFFFFFAHLFLRSHWMTAHQWRWTLCVRVCVFLWTQTGRCPCLCSAEATVSFRACFPWVLPSCWHFMYILNKQTNKQTHSRNVHVTHRSLLWAVVFLSTVVTFLLLNHLPLLLF